MGTFDAARLLRAQIEALEAVADTMRSLALQSDKYDAILASMTDAIEAMNARLDVHSRLLFDEGEHSRKVEG